MKLNYTSKFFVLCFLSILSIAAKAQNSNYLNDVTVNPPNAASLGKYGDIPISLHTGIPNVGIPIHTLTETGGLSVPVSLSYHASGVKVTETSSWVGSNWTLNAGGAITRTVRNAPDEGLNRNGSGFVRGFGYARRTLTQMNNDLYPAPGYTYDPPLTAANIWEGYLDTEPDAFNFNVGGYTGKFYIKAGGCIDPNNPQIMVSSSNQDVKIRPYFVQGNNAWCGRFDYWVITVPDGTKYYFGQPNANEFDGSDKAVDLTMNYTYAKQADFDVTVSAWYLTKVESADGLNSIALDYNQERYRYTNLGSTEVSDTRLVYERAMHTDVVAAKLNRISTKWEKMDFITKTVDRKDLDATASTFFTTNYPALQSIGMARALEYIVLKDSALATLKKFKFETDYFVSGTSGSPSISGALNTDSDIYRLRLKSLTQMDAAETVATQSKHSFEYINTGETPHPDGVNAKLPRRKSYAIDHWGFNNGKTNNAGLGGQGEIYTASRVDYGIPESTFNTTTGEIAAQAQAESSRIGVDYNIISPMIFNITNDLKLFGDGVSGDKKPSFPDVQEGSLFKINYPTGGFTQFEYEPNKYKSKVEDFKLYSQFDNKYTMASNTLTMSNGNISLPAGTDATRLKYTAKISYFGGPSPASVQFRTKVFRNGNPLPVKDKIQFSIDQGQSSRSFSGNFLVDFELTAAPLLSSADNITIQIFPEPMVGNYAIELRVFTHTLGIVDNGEKVGGGMRVKTVTTSDGVNPSINIVKNYEYKKNNLSTGVAFSKPSAVQDLMITTLSRTAYDLQYPPSNEQIMPQQVNNNVISPSYALYDANTHPTTPYVAKIAKGTILGVALNNQTSPVGYSTVIVRQAGVGYSEYNYNTDLPASSNTIPTYPAIPETSISGQVGNLTSEIHVTEGNVVQKTVNYQYTEAVRDSAVGVIISPSGQSYGRLKRYRVKTDYNVVMNQKTETVDGVTTTTSMVYNSTWQHHNPVETTVTNSDYIPYKTKTYYAHEMGNTDLINRNMVGVPLKTEQYINNVLKSGSQTLYGSFSTTYGYFPRPALIQSLRRDAITWDTKMTINTYESTTGLPTSTTKQGFSVSETYGWTNKLLTSKTFGGLTWNYEYKLNTNMVSQVLDENRLRTKFYYDALQRLQKVDNRMKDDGTDIQATINYTYQYKDASNPFSYVGTSSSFKGVTTPLSTKQYMDGLGRPISTVRENYTPAGQNQVNIVTYDNIGRQDKGYLPFQSTGTTLVAGTPFTFPTYEQSPLSRPLKQTNVDGTSVTMSYGTNTAADNVRNFIFTPVQGASGTVTNNNVYHPAGLFYKTTTWDENGSAILPTATSVGKTEIYKDKLGRAILTRKFLNGQNVDTYNIYDDYGSLVMVIPPGALDASGNPIATLVFSYTYDSRNRLIEKKVPGADPQKFFYDERDLLTLVQDGNMRNPAYGGNANRYMGTQYNTIGQVLRTGWVTTASPLSTALAVTVADADRLTETQYYTNRSWVRHQGARVIDPANPTVTNFVWSYIERRVGLEYTGNPIWMGKQHLLNGPLPNRPVLDSDGYGVDWTVSAYNGMQQPDYTLRYMYGNAANGTLPKREVRTRTDFTYDNGRRMTNMKYTHALDGAQVGVPTFTLANMVYNFKDQVTEKNTAFVNNKYLQSTDFAYNDRGFLTSINSGFLPSALDLPLFAGSSVGAAQVAYENAIYQFPAANSGEHNADLFKEIIRYDNPNTAYPGAGAAQRNGNISQIEWQVAGKEAQGYSYKYDDLDRLTEANYTDIHGSNWASKGWNSQYETDNKFQEKQTYDLRGNIQSLTRNGLWSNIGGIYGFPVGLFNMIDNLTYTYNPSDANRLDKVTDAGNTGYAVRGFKTATNNSLYTYDANGNLTSDLNKNITSITYNHLNLPLVISFTGNNRIEFIYDASGAKLRKSTYANNALQERRDYIGGIEYKNDVLDRFAHTEGAVVNQAGAYVYEYNIKDHLGNTRVTYSDANNDGV